MSEEEEEEAGAGEDMHRRERERKREGEGEECSSVFFFLSSEIDVCCTFQFRSVSLLLASLSPIAPLTFSCPPCRPLAAPAVRSADPPRRSPLLSSRAPRSLELPPPQLSRRTRRSPLPRRAARVTSALAPRSSSLRGRRDPAAPWLLLRQLPVSGFLSSARESERTSPQKRGGGECGSGNKKSSRRSFDRLPIAFGKKLSENSTPTSFF